MSSKNAEKAIKSLVRMKHKTDPPFDGQPFDVVILIMGPTGVGKSTFINYLLDSSQTKVTVGNGLNSCTSRVDPIVIPFGHGKNGFKNPNSNNEGRLVLVDTPGFDSDDEYGDDAEVFLRISVWLGISYATNMQLGGVIYLHDIMETRMSGTPRYNLDIFRTLVGKDALRCVVLGTTKWSLVQPDAGARREGQLKSEFWKDMIKAKSQVVRVINENTPREIVNNILRNRAKPTEFKVEFLKIQKELVHLQKLIPETEAGRILKPSLDQLIKLQKRQKKTLTPEELTKAQQELDRLLEMARELPEVGLWDRIKRVFGL